MNLPQFKLDRAPTPNTCYNLHVMTPALLRVWPLTLAVVMVALPMLGPALDHHFAERQPYHAHVGADPSHSHDYRVAHAHPVDAATGEPAADGALVLYSLQVLSIAPPAILLNSGLDAMLNPDAASALAAPAAPEAALASALVPVPKRPPRA